MWVQFLEIYLKSYQHENDLQRVPLELRFYSVEDKFNDEIFFSCLL